MSQLQIHPEKPFNQSSIYKTLARATELPRSRAIITRRPKPLPDMSFGRSVACTPRFSLAFVRSQTHALLSRVRLVSEDSLAGVHMQMGRVRSSLKPRASAKIRRLFLKSELTVACVAWPVLSHCLRRPKKLMLSICFSTKCIRYYWKKHSLLSTVRVLVTFCL